VESLKLNYQLIEVLSPYGKEQGSTGIYLPCECNKSVSTYCSKCPGQPVLCQECFESTHKTQARTSHTLTCHIGVVNGVFSADNLPPEWKEQLKQAGVRKKDLNSPELRDLLFGLILDAGGNPEDASNSHNNTNNINTSSKSSPLPQPSQSLPQPSLPQQSLPQQSLPQHPLPTPKPHTPQPTLPQQPLPQPNTKTTPSLPQPSLPSQRPMPQVTASDDSPMMRGTPPPIKNTATNSTEQPTGRAPRGPRGPATNLGGGSHKAEVEEKPTQAPVKKEPTHPALPGSGDLMAEIARGKALRPTTEREIDSKPLPQGGLAGALSAALEANRIALGGALDDGSEGSDWD